MPYGQIEWNWRELRAGGGGILFANEPVTQPVVSLGIAFPEQVHLSLQEVIQAYGEPSHVLATAISYFPEVGSGYGLSLVYLEQGFWLNASGRADIQPDLAIVSVRFFTPGLENYTAFNLNFADRPGWLVPWAGFQRFEFYCHDDYDGRVCRGEVIETPVFQDTPLTAPPASTFSPTPTPSKTAPAPELPPETILRYQPFEILSAVPPEAHPAGLLFFSGPFDHYLLNLAQGTTQALPEVGFGFCTSTSPDGQWLTYCPTTANTLMPRWLIVANAQGRQHKQIALEVGWQYAKHIRWLDTQRLALNLEDPEIWWANSMVALNPFTGEQQKLISDYPGLRPPRGISPHFLYGSVIYHPSLNLVVYPALDPKGDPQIVLWNRQTQTEMARLVDFNDFGHPPLWAPNSDFFVVPAAPAAKVVAAHNTLDYNDEWFRVSHMGAVQQITHFSDFFTEVHIGHASWSPDGQYLAFWLETVPSPCPGENLTVLAMLTQQATNYCLLGSDTGGTPARAPVWSLDGRYIAVSSFQKGAPAGSLLIDIQQGWATAIGETNSALIGWLMVTP